MKKLLFAVGFIGLGLLFGGLLFSDVQPRSMLAIRDCHTTCLNDSDIAGLLASIGIQKLPDIIPGKILETDKTIVFQHPSPTAPIHYLVVPKKDIRAAGEISVEDEEYLLDAYAAMGEVIRRENLVKYRVITNGPGFQDVTYLHFHLRAEEPEEE